MLQNLSSEDGDIVSGIGLSSNVEVLLGILGEVVEEERKEGIDVLSGGDSVADAVAAVRVPNIDGLVDEDDRGVVVPSGWVVDKLNLLVDASRSQLQEETGQGRAAWATIEPQDYRVVLRVVS